MIKDIWKMDDMEAAHAMAGNHRKWKDFGWYNRPADDANWAIFNFETRDSDALTRSNAIVIQREFSERFPEPEDWRVERHSHWAVGWVNALIVRVFNGNDITPEAAHLINILRRLDDYPSLDDDLFSEIEYNDQIDEITGCCEFGYSEDQAYKIHHAMTNTGSGEFVFDDDKITEHALTLNILSRCPACGEIEFAAEALGYCLDCFENDPPILVEPLPPHSRVHFYAGRDWQPPLL
jgi:hypothetical protein